MKTFKEFLSEVARSPQKAHKVLDRIAKMKAFKAVPYENARGDGPVITPANYKKPEEGGVFLKSMTMRLKQKRYVPEKKRIAIKDIITPQRAVNVQGIKHKLDGTRPDPKPGMKFDVNEPDVYYDHDKKEYHLWNGNHRIYAARLKGETHIDVNVYHKNSKKINEEKDMRPLEVFNDDLRKKHGAEVDLSLYGDKEIHIHHIKVPKEKRKQGIGSAIMKDINDYADQGKKRVTLNPGSKDDRHGTTSRNRLIKFYKRHGYVHNKGRNKDFTTSAAMYRDPK